MIQGTINRLASQASSMKGFAFTAVGLITAIASQAKAPNLYLLAMAVAVLFMLLDATYLTLEKRYRDLFNEVRKGEIETPPDFNMTPPEDPYLVLVWATKLVCLASLYQRNPRAGHNLAVPFSLIFPAIIIK
jgi:hypothetical protein